MTQPIDNVLRQKIIESIQKTSSKSPFGWFTVVISDVADDLMTLFDEHWNSAIETASRRSGTSLSDLLKKPLTREQKLAKALETMPCSCSELLGHNPALAHCTKNIAQRALRNAD